MQILENSLLVFRTRQPDKYKVIPNSAILSENEGIYEVAVKWAYEECRVLKNLGVKAVPSPILKNYTWPGAYVPMKHQKDTAAFLTLNHRAFCFNEPGCVDAETEYLSPLGWRKISTYVGGEVAQYHADTGNISFVLPEKYVKLPCADMIHFKTKYGVDQMLSPEHRMLVHSNHGGYAKQAVMSAAKVFAKHEAWHAGEPQHNARKAGSEDIAFSSSAIPAAFFGAGGPGVTLSDAELRVQIAVIADAHFSNATNRCVVRIKKERKVLRLRALLAAADIDFVERRDTSATGAGFYVFTFNAPKRIKKFDSYFWGCSAAQLAVVRDEVMHWDGSDRGETKGDQFFSIEKESADFVQYAFASAGIVSRITEDVRPNRNTVYVVTVRGAAEPRFLTLKSRHNRTATECKSTDGFKYCFMVPTSFLLFRRNGCIFASGNTGKTMSCLWAADYLMSRGLVRRVLVLCPLSIMHAAWADDIINSVMHRSYVVAYHTNADKRKEAVRGGYEIVISNYDGLEIIAKDIIEDGKFDLVIVDECNHVKNSKTQRWKTLFSILNNNTRLWMLTGTPAPQSPMDAYGLAKLVNPAGVPRFIGAWRDKVMRKITQFKWIAKDEAPKLVHTALQPAIRFTKAECLDLPPVVTEVRQVKMTPQQEKYYNQMKKDQLIQAQGEPITAVNAAIVVNKLLQISSGAVYSDKKLVVDFDCTPRLNELLSIIEDTDRKVIVFVPFTHSLATIKGFLDAQKIDSAIIDGGVSNGDRRHIFSRFQAPTDSLRVCLIQPQAAAHGVTLTAANTVVFWGPVSSVETYVQCCARADRVGQNAESVTVFHLQASDVEKRMYKKLKENIFRHDLITDLYEEILS